MTFEKLPQALQAQLEKMEEFEKQFSAVFAVDRETGLFLYGQVIQLKAKNILELGTWRGASSLYMAAALEAIGGGEITTVDVMTTRYDDATRNIDASGYRKYITQVKQDAKDFLAEDRTVYDFIFLDAEKKKQGEWIKSILKHNVHPGTRIIIDDAILMGDRMEDLFAYIKEQPVKSRLEKISDGLFIIDI
jgi:predicted O-methyltransferase YrrM